jgi:hypothetical protein
MAGWGVFRWNRDGRYPESAAVKTFSRESDANKYATPRELVVRSLGGKTQAEKTADKKDASALAKFKRLFG